MTISISALSPGGAAPGVGARLLTLAAALCLAPDAPRAGAVLRVGPTRPFTTIQQAVNAAALSGDLILVDAGSYAPFDVVGKGVAILADLPTAPFTLLSSSTRPVVRIIAVPAGRTVTVGGWQTTVPFGAAPPLQVLACTGSVRISDAVLDPTADLIDVPMRAIVDIRSCESVSLYDVRVASSVARNGRTTNGIPAPGGTDRGIAAVVAQDSSVHLVRCVVRGYDNLGTPATGRWGGDGLRLFDSSVARIDASFTQLRGGAGGQFGGSAIQLIAASPVPDVLACAVNVGAYVKGPGPNPGGFFSINHDRGIVGSAERFVAACIFESAGFAVTARRMSLNTQYNITLSSFFPRAFSLFIGPTGFLKVPGVENTGYLDYTSPLTVLVAGGALPTPPVVTLPVTIPNDPNLRGFQFGVQAVLGPPTGQTVPQASFTLADIVVIVP